MIGESITKEKKSEKKSETDKEKKARELLEKDNQVRRALELLKGWAVFSKINEDTSGDMVKQ